MKPVRWVQIAMVLLFSAAASPYAAEAPDSEVLEKASAAFAATAERVLPGVVAITASTKPSPVGEMGGSLPAAPSTTVDQEQARAAIESLQNSTPRESLGSGFLVSAAGLIVTANFVVEKADKIMVRLHDGKELEAKLVGADRLSQVAVLKVEGKDLPILRLGDSTEVEVGHWVMSAGHPFGLRTSLSSGIVGAVGVHGLGNAAFEDYIQTDAAMQRGCSGGPLLNVRGEVVGMNVAIASQSGSFEGAGFAVPVNMVKTVKDQIAASGKMVYSYLGVAIQDLNRKLADSAGLDDTRGVRVGRINPASPAEKAGLAYGDVILEMDGKIVTNMTSFRKMVAFTPPGTQVTLTILRDGERKKIDVVLDARPTQRLAACSRLP